ncbi:MAG: sigma 54-interacting transcriptional regulator, partial [Thermodesulfobacteriota bacterium]
MENLENFVPRLLIIDDEPDMLSLLKRSLYPELKWEILTAQSGKEALRILNETPIDLLLLDVKMPEMDGMQLLLKVREKPESPTVIMMTAYGVIELAVESIKNGAYDFITKPIDETRLLITLQKALEYHRLIHEHQRLRDRIRGESAMSRMIGSSRIMQKIFESIRTVSQTDATVLIVGESGTGKELAAKAIHELSPRSRMPLVVVNCPTLPEAVLESELFGYGKGAFTDAKQDKKGLFLEANQGTILLDE